METAIPGLIVSALKGGAGKSILTIGITAAIRALGKSVAPFKKGPDYIDAGWLALAAGQACYNLDLFLVEPTVIRQSYLQHTRESDIAIIEGNRGLYDGIDVEGKTSTAEIAKLLQLPVVMCVDCTKTTRTMAAALLGCLQFDPDVRIAAVILNRVAGPRHENILRQSIEYHSGIPVIGALPKLRQGDFPERHMGLVPTPEHSWAGKSVVAALNIAQKYINLDQVLQIAVEQSPPLPPVSGSFNQPVLGDREADPTRIGVVRDSAFQFYYQENLDALEAAGARLVFTSPLAEESPPNVDALYIGGGFPETHAKQLSANVSYRQAVKRLAAGGLPVYAECGGLIYLGEQLQMDAQTYAMTGVFPIVFGLSKRPQGHGYTIMKVDRENPYFPKGSELKGHEFRYSTVEEWRGSDQDMIFTTLRGKGFFNQRDGLAYKNVLATYTHTHALGTPEWAPAMVAAARLYRLHKK